MTRFLGIDPGIATTGYGIVDHVGSQLKLVAFGVISTASTDALPKRLLKLAHELSAIIHHFQPQAVAVEELFFNTNAKTALIVGQARGVILVTLERHELPIAGYTPLQVKTAVCGYGRADKNQVQYMVKKLLNLPKPPKPDDAADALAIAICHCHSFRMSLR